MRITHCNETSGWITTNGGAAAGDIDGADYLSIIQTRQVGLGQDNSPLLGT